MASCRSEANWLTEFNRGLQPSFRMVLGGQMVPFRMLCLGLQGCGIRTSKQ